jgi:release factor glutamine methyltransferase
MAYTPAQKFDVIVANPPYIAESDPMIQDSVKKFEPHEALFASEDGFNDIINWSRKYSSHLAKPGVVLFEMGHLQGAKSKELFTSLNVFSDVQILKDLSGLDRIVKAVNNG